MWSQGIAGLAFFPTAGLIIPLGETWQSCRHSAATGAHRWAAGPLRMPLYRKSATQLPARNAISAVTASARRIAAAAFRRPAACRTRVPRRLRRA